jgi:hypothetical protein
LVASPPKSNPRRASVLSQFLHAVKPSWGGSSTGSHAGIGHHVAKKSALDPHEIDAPQLAADTHEMGIQLAPEDDEDSGNTDESDIELAAPREAATSASRAITTAHAQLYGVKYVDCCVALVPPVSSLLERVTQLGPRVVLLYERQHDLSDRH